MAGHSKWANIKRHKAVVDAKRGKLFTKASKEIIVAARLGGGDVDGNPRLRFAVLNARSISMPAENIKRAIQRGTGAIEGATYEEMTYEGYGPGGVALIIECTTENRNRTIADLRALLTRHGGNMGEPNSVAWNFVRKGELRTSTVQIIAGKENSLSDKENSLSGKESALSEDDLMEIALDAGADDVQIDGQVDTSMEPQSALFYCATDVLAQCNVALTAAGLDVRESRFVYEAMNTTVVDDVDVARKLVKVLDALEDNDDVQNVYNNADISDDVLSAMDAA